MGRGDDVENSHQEKKKNLFITKILNRCVYEYEEGQIENRDREQKNVNKNNCLV